MKANPDKFQAICIGQKTHDYISSFNIHDTEIKCDDSVKLLGVDIDFNLKMDEHVSNICKKASKQLCVLKRIGKDLSKQGKVLIFKSFILSNFNYCPLAWHFCSLRSTRKMEKIQERAIRFIENDFTSPLADLLKINKLSFLHISRIRNMACEVVKILNKIAPEYINNLIHVKKSVYNFRRGSQLEVPRVNTTRYGLKSFRYEAARIWNILPEYIKKCETFSEFRGLLHVWDGPVCTCSICST